MRRNQGFCNLMDWKQGVSRKRGEKIEETIIILTQMKIKEPQSKNLKALTRIEVEK